MKKFIAMLLLVSVFSSCGEYQKVLKSEDLGVKYELASKLYDDGSYTKAIRLFEQIAPSYRGKPEAEKMFYMYAQSFYKTKQYYISGDRFESFVAAYPKSDKAEEAAYLGAISYSKLSPVYSLDQVDTYKAIDKLQSFINVYPESQYLGEANIVVKALREKLEKKAYEVAKQYNKIYDYKSAIVALENFVIEYPGTPYKEKALFYKFDSAYNLAIKSVQSKMENRLNEAKAAHASFAKFNANSEFKPKADAMMSRIETDLKQFSK